MFLVPHVLNGHFVHICPTITHSRGLPVDPAAASVAALCHEEQSGRRKHCYTREVSLASFHQIIDP